MKPKKILAAAPVGVRIVPKFPGRAVAKAKAASKARSSDPAWRTKSSLFKPVAILPGRG
jgi:hypothetical protein